MTNVICAISGHPAKLVAANVGGYRQGLIYDLYHCSICDSSFANPLTTDPEIYEQVYNSASQILGYSRYLGFAERILNQREPLKWLSRQEATYQYVESSLHTLEQKDTEILEIGSGLGYLTYALNRTGYRVLGVDISAGAVATARERYGNFYTNHSLDALEKAGRKFDLIIALEVIEHTADPQAMISAAMRLLSRKGKLLITTPNRDMFSTDNVWSTDLPPMHLWWLSSTSLRFLADRMGLDIFFPDLNESAPQRRVSPGSPILDASGMPLKLPGIMNRLSLATDGHLQYLKNLRRHFSFVWRQHSLAKSRIKRGSDTLAAIYSFHQ